MGTIDKLTLTAAATAIGISYAHLRRLIADGAITPMRGEKNKRARFVRFDEVQRVKATLNRHNAKGGAQ